MTRDAWVGRRRGRGLAVVVAVACVLALACDDDADPDGAFGAPVEIGPGSEDTPPAETLADGSSDEEPEWVDRVPTLVAPRAGAAARATALDLAATSGLSSPPRGGSASTSRSSADDYVGTMTLEIAYYDYCQTYDGNLGFAGSAQYEMEAEVHVGPPAEHEGVHERSPFNLMVASETGVEGSIFLWSAAVITDGRDGRSAIFDYWDVDADGEEVSGVLTDRWAPIIYNSIEATQLLVPCRAELGTIVQRDSIAEGAELTGTVTEDRVELEVLAQSFDRELRFRAVVDAEQRE